MDTDNSGKQNQQFNSELEEPGSSDARYFDACNFFSSRGLRCIVCDDNALDRFLLVNGCYFLLPITVIFWIIFLATTYL